MQRNEKEIIALSKIIIQNYNIKNSRNLKKIIRTKPINILVESIELTNDLDVLKFMLFSSIKIRLGEIFISLSYSNKLAIIKNANKKLIKDIFDDIEIDDVYELVNDIPKEEFKKLLLSISSDVRRELINLSRYEEGEIGSVMNSSFVTLNEDLTIAKAVKVIELNKEEIELNGTIFISDNNNKLVGQIQIYDILLEKQRSIKLKKIMDLAIVSVNNHENIDDLINIFQKYEVRIVPVVNSENVLLGFINDSDIISVIQEENTEDIYKMYGINELDKPYTRTKVLDIVKSRIFWLILLMVASTFTSMALEELQNLSSLWTNSTISTLILVPIIPVISGTSGNAGSQSAATIIRSLSIGEINANEYKKTILKEFSVALIIGLILSVVNFARLMIYYQIFPIDISALNTKWNIYEVSAIISAGISLALFLAILLSKVVGSLLPLIAVKIKIDPAAMASPLLTTLIDTLTITILFLLGAGIIYGLIV